MIFDSGHPDVMRPTGIRQTGAVPGSVKLSQVVRIRRCLGTQQTGRPLRMTGSRYAGAPGRVKPSPDRRAGLARPTLLDERYAKAGPIARFLDRAEYFMVTSWTPVVGSGRPRHDSQQPAVASLLFAADRFLWTRPRHREPCPQDTSVHRVVPTWGHLLPLRRAGRNSL